MQYNIMVGRHHIQIEASRELSTDQLATLTSLARGYFDQVLDVLDTELTTHQPFGAEFGTRTGITALQGFAEAAFAWQANLELRTTQAF